LLAHATHSAPTHVSFAVHVFPHDPQLSRSDVRSTHGWPLHVVSVVFVLEPPSHETLSVYVTSYVRHAPNAANATPIATLARFTREAYRKRARGVWAGRVGRACRSGQLTCAGFCGRFARHVARNRVAYDSSLTRARFDFPLARRVRR
jgi:hypothetical protein